MPATFPSSAKLKFPGYAKERESGVLRTAMEAGPAKQQRVKTRVAVTRRLVYTFDSYADYEAFTEWFRDTVNQGADWFTWTDPEDATAKLARIVSKLDEERPVRRALDRWDVSLSIETWG